MVDELHELLRRLVYEEGRISPFEVDVRFEAPTRQLADRLMLPAISLFLFDLRENTELRQGGYQLSKSNGHAERRQPPRRIDLHFMVSALTTEIVDEHRLLWRALAALMRHREIPAALLPEQLRGVEPAITLRVAQPDDDQRLLDLWGGLELEPHPALHLVLTVPLDLEITVRAPLVLTRSAQYLRVHDAADPREVGIQIGGYLRDRKGQPLVGAAVRVAGSGAEPSLTGVDGAFRLQGLQPGSVTLEIVRADGSRVTQEIAVPADSYDLVWR